MGERGEKLGYEADPAVVLELKQPGPADRDPFHAGGIVGNALVKGLARKMFDTMSMYEVEQIARESVDDIPELRYALAEEWPADKSMELVELAVSLKLPSLLDVHARALGQNQGVLLLHKLLSRGLEPSFVRGIFGKSDAFSFISGAEDVSPRIRAEMMRHMGDVDPDSADEEIESFQDTLARRDVSAFLFPKDDPEPVQDFKTGDNDAIGLLREYQRLYPDYHEERDLRIELFQKLAKIDPVRAVVLLDSMDPSDRRGEIESLLAREGESLHPDVTYQLFTLLPLPQDEAGLHTRFLQWQHSNEVSRNLDQEDYRHWAEHLPTGVERDLVLAALADEIDGKEPEEAARLREQISHSAIRSFR
jgi:hypothetical protein